MSWSLSNYWGGLDGNWSTWNITVGIPEQSFRVLVSTSGSELTLPFTSYCAHTQQPLVCGSSRGVIPSQNHSASIYGYGYSPNGSQYADAQDESDMMYNFNNVEEEFAEVVQPSTVWPDLGTKFAARELNQTQLLYVGWRSKVMEADPDKGTFLGAIGLKAIPSTHWMWPTGRHYIWSWDNKLRSLLQRLAGQTQLTMGYAYTPGAHYRNTHGSLSIGYYNPALLSPNARSFPFSPPDDSLNFTLLSISVSRTLHTQSPHSLLSTPLSSTILDSTTPFLLLPETTCRHFQHSFGLDYEPSTGLFLVNTSTHLQLREINPTFTFELASVERDHEESQNNDASESMKVVLPYQSFDLYFRRSWDDDEPRAYFPIKIAEPGAVNVLGRSFLQEVYLVVNYSFFNFTISQIALHSPTNASSEIQMLEKIPFGLEYTSAGVFDKLVMFYLEIFVFVILYLWTPLLTLIGLVVVVFFVLIVFYVPRWARLRVREIHT